MKSQDSQVLAALAITASLLVIALGCLVTAYLLNDAGPAWGAVGAVVGALATALNAPSGISSVIAASKSPPAAPTPPPPADPPPPPEG